MNTFRILSLATAAAAAASVAVPALALPHTREHKILTRVHNQERRITAERREGDLTRTQALALRSQDHAIAHQARADFVADGHHLSKKDEHQLTVEENAQSKAIGK